MPATPSTPAILASRFESRVAVRGLWGLNRAFVHCWHRLDLLGRCTVPREGPAILVCNHISSLDPAFLQGCTPRHIRWMMAAEYLSIRPLRPFFDTIGVIPVARGTRDTTSTRSALRAIANGDVIGIFPEGRIAKTSELLPFHPGAALLASRTGVPVIPAAIEGTMRGTGVFSAYIVPQSACVRFGEPLTTTREPGDHGLRIMMERLTTAVRDLYRSLKYSSRRDLP